MKLFTNIFGLGAILVAGSTFAHEVYFDCRTASPESVICLAGFSDGSDAPNMPIYVFDYNDQELVKGQTDAESSFSFKRPEGEFYIRLDGGQGHQVEVDHSQIN